MIDKSKKPKPAAVYHWSTACAQQFDAGHFKVKTQGRLYGVVSPHARWGVSKTIKGLSLLVFAGPVLEDFARHPRWGGCFFKGWLGQYWTRAFGDYRWEPEDMVRCGSVVLVTRGRIAAITDIGRLWDQRARVWIMRLLDLVHPGLAATLAAILILEDHPDWPGHSWANDMSTFLQHHQPQLWQWEVMAVVFGVWVLFTLFGGEWLKRRQSTRPEGWENDLWRAVSMAKAQGLLPQDYDIGLVVSQSQGHSQAEGLDPLG
ncbi:hypothetical protein [Azospirillum sp. B4]|uniref:hypothetical protein n=1 Tax=Azospirillum sp. B4 TaxID=95605 RepID=UPI0003492D8A|nr:hypothetical protein [Azospirillum sp. B4]